MGAPIGIFALTSVATAFFVLFESSRYSVSILHVWMICCAFVIQLFLRVLYYIFFYPFCISPFRGLPQPPGHVFWKGQLGNMLTDPVKWSATIPNNGLIRYFDKYNAEKILVTTPKGFADVLVNNSYDFVKPAHVREQWARFLRLGLLITEGEIHQRQRKYLLRAFAFRNLKNLYPTFWSKTAETVKSIQEALLENDTIEIGNWISRAVLDIIGIAVIGDDFNTIKKPNNELVRVYLEVLKQNPSLQFKGPLTLVIPLWILLKLPLERSRQIENGGALIRNHCRNLISQNKWKMKNREYNSDIISIATRSGGFSDDELADQMMTFLAAGHETSTLAVQWAICLLGKYQDIQTRLRGEIRAHLPSPSDKHSHDRAAAALDSVAYLHAVCNEVFRLYPAIPFNIREAAKNTSILGHHIPKGTKVTFSAWGMNVSKEQWGEDAGEFNPDRWMFPGRANTGGAKSNYAFETFVHGPRSCIGMGFAKAEVACLVGAIIGRFEIRLEKPEEIMKIPPGAPVKALHVRMKTVDGW